MPLILPGNVASATTAVYEVANSSRWNGSLNGAGDSTKMTRTPSGDGNLDDWTYSTWIKLDS